MFVPFSQVVYRQLHSVNRDGGHVDCNWCEVLVCDAFRVVKVHEPSCRKYEPVECLVIVRVVRDGRFPRHVR